MADQQIFLDQRQKRPIESIMPQELQSKLRSKQDVYYYIDK